MKFTLDDENIVSEQGIDDRDIDGATQFEQGYDLGSLTKGLVAYYPMEEGQGQVLHDGALDNLGQIEGASWTTGQVGSNALSFDGVDDLATVPHSSELNLLNSLTISGWVRVDNLSDIRNIIQKRPPDSIGIPYNIFVRTDGTIGFQIRDTSTYRVWDSPSNEVTVGNWVYITVTKVDDDTIQIYVNGNAVTTTKVVDSGSIDDKSNTVPVRFAYQSTNGDHSPIDLDSIRLYDRALSTPEIEALYNLTSPSGYLVEEEDLVTQQAPPSKQDESAFARYEFNGDVTDSWGENDGTDNTSAGFADGVFGQAKDFDGTDDYINSNISSISAPVTMSAWVNRDSVSGNRGIISNFNSSSSDFFFRFEDSINSVQIGVIDSTGQDVANGSTQIDPNTWYHTLFTLDTLGNLSLYINGSIEESVTTSAKRFDNGTNIEIAGLPALTEYWNGQIDDIRIYTKALDPIEVEQLFNKGSYRIKRNNL